MEALARLSFVGTSLVMLVLGSRLLLVSRRTRQVPEFVVGLAYVLGIVGIFALIVSSDLLRAGRGSFPLWLSGHVAIQTANCAMVFGVRRIFRPADRWAFQVMLFGLLWGIVCIVEGGLRGRIETYERINAHLLLTTGFALFTYAWTTFEALRYTGLLRRRRTLGLADTLSVWRFRCWGIGASTAACVSILSLASVAVYGQGLSRVLWIFVATQLLLVASSTATWFAFFPPVFYRRRADARDPELAS